MGVFLRIDRERLNRYQSSAAHNRHPLGCVPLFLCANLAIEFIKIINSSLSASVIHYMRTKHRQIAYATYAKIQQDSRKENEFSQTLAKPISMVYDMSVRQSAARTTMLIVNINVLIALTT